MIARPSSQLITPAAISQAGMPSGGTAIAVPSAAESVEGIVDRRPPVSSSGRPRQERAKSTVATIRAQLRPAWFFHASQSQISAAMTPTTIAMPRMTLLISLAGSSVPDPDVSAASRAAKSDDR